MDPKTCLVVTVSAGSPPSGSCFGFYQLSSTKGEAVEEERRRVGLLSAGQVGVKHLQLACAKY